LAFTGLDRIGPTNRTNLRHLHIFLWNYQPAKYPTTKTPAIQDINSRLSEKATVRYTDTTEENLWELGKASRRGKEAPYFVDGDQFRGVVGNGPIPTRPRFPLSGLPGWAGFSDDVRTWLVFPPDRGWFRNLYDMKADELIRIGHKEYAKQDLEKMSQQVLETLCGSIKTDVESCRRLLKQVSEELDRLRKAGRISAVPETELRLIRANIKTCKEVVSKLCKEGRRLVAARQNVEDELKSRAKSTKEDE